MGVPYYSEFNISHEELYSELERLRSENYHLKRRLSHEKNVNRGKSKMIASLNKKLKEGNRSGQHYRNGRKRGANGFNG